MHWQLSDEQELFASSLREWLGAKFSTDIVRGLQDSNDSSTFVSALVSEGWWGVGYPEDLGGQGGGVLELALAAREFGRSAVPDTRWLAAALAAPLLTEDELTAQLAGDRAFAVAVRADRIPAPALLPTEGLLSTEGPRLTGTVRHVIGAVDADVLLVPVDGPDGRGMARVSTADAAVTADGLLDRSRSTATVTFDGATIIDVVSDDGPALERVTAVAAVLLAADALGCAERMLELAVEYSRQRKQFGQFIGSFQAVKHAAAQMLVTVEASYSIALYAAAAVEAGLADAALSAAVAKAQVTRSVAELADTALTVHGAIGYTWEHDLQLFYKRAKLDRALFGTPTAWNERVAAELLDHPAA
ncbi:acyl-CoA/acyl-ACP dehydrogenase [Gordonia sp. zg691]|uniref:acyl-CoA dehydrogenase family protein n=1 Tax=Gordonia jinghuaiqii TaxID=2758710 RepID=UPI0016623177|nr:acyl-CoA dehydrogenase family protein [Gordonia jinghuaiqii]MBD0860309.1 acyl-CoA/acyl-ACP dehydrogenase [Gordonia jinghuaiqii]